MAKLKFTIAGPEDPIFNEGINISSRRLKSKKILYIDMDNVLVDFPSGIAALSEQDWTAYKGKLIEEISDEETLRKLFPYEFSVEFDRPLWSKGAIRSIKNSMIMLSWN